MNTMLIYNSEFTDNATISIYNKAVVAGLSVYESISIINSIAIFLEEHINRLSESAKKLEFKEVNTKRLFNDVYRLIEKNKLKDANVRILLLEDASYYIYSNPLLVYTKDQIDNGIDLILSKAERTLPSIKTSNAIAARLALKKATDQNCFEALLVDRDDYALEGSRTNLYGFKDGIIYTASKEFILPGVTRSHILKTPGFTIKLQKIKAADLLNDFFDEVAISATSMGILHVKKIEGKEVGRTKENSIKIREHLNNLRKEYEISRN